jgi:hypothetical protein
MSYGGRIRIGALASGVALAAGLLAGCGGGKDFAGKPRPPAPLYLNGVITSSGVNISPNRVGAGPVVIQVSNQTLAAHTLTLDGNNIEPVQSASIAPTDVGTIQTTLEPGTYTVKAGSLRAVRRELRPAHLVIGRQRPNSDNQVGLP